MANQLSREEYRKNRIAAMEEEEAVRGKQPKASKDQEKQAEIRKTRKRRFPIWLRLIAIIVLMVISVVVGAVIGYSVVGDGDAGDVFNKETWTHISDLVNQKK